MSVKQGRARRRRQGRMGLAGRTRVRETDLGPLNEVRVLDAVRVRARGLGQRAERELDLRREEPERAVEAGGDSREDDASVALEPLRASVHHWYDAAHVQFSLLVVL